MSAEGSTVSVSQTSAEKKPRSEAEVKFDAGLFDFQPISEPDFADYIVEPVLWGEDLFLGGECWGPDSTGTEPFRTPEETAEIYYKGEQEEEEGMEDTSDVMQETTFGERKKKYAPTDHGVGTTADFRRKSLFIHSSPMHFQDVTRARKSAFGSIFLKTTANSSDDEALLKSIADGSYSMIQSLLTSFERIISMPTSPADRRHMTIAYKESLLRALEAHGISKTYSDGSVQWNIYPVMQNYLFSIQVGDHLHQSRLLSKIEDRILNGPLLEQRLPYAWSTDSNWTGCWDALGMAGLGTYNMLHGVSYFGKMRDGVFEDGSATLTYPNEFKALHCVYEEGVLKSCQFEFPDLLMHEKENWGYCKFPDRRFWSEVRKGLKPAKIAQKTELDPPRHIPRGCYDTSDGFYNPLTMTLVDENGELLRVPICEEDVWIKKHCRKGFFEYSNFRPDYFENWFDFNQEIIETLINAQSKYRIKKISYDELQQVYADLGLLPSWSNYKKRQTPSEIALEKHFKSCVEPKPLKKRKPVEKFKSHDITEVLVDLTKSEIKPDEEMKKSRSHFTSGTTSAKSSKITVRFSSSSSNSVSYQQESTTPGKRIIPEKFMKHQPILRPPFQSAAQFKHRPDTSRRICRSLDSTESESYVAPEDASTGRLLVIERQNLIKFMKKIVMEVVNNILTEERDRHRKRLMWAKPLQKRKPKEMNSEKCLKVLEKLFESIPEKDEYCDSCPDKTCDLRRLAEDKYETLKYWGNRIFYLDFGEGKGD